MWGLGHHGNNINEFSDSLQHCGRAREVVIGPWIREINCVCGCVGVNGDRGLHAQTKLYGYSRQFSFLKPLHKLRSHKTLALLKKVCCYYNNLPS